MNIFNDLPKYRTKWKEEERRHFTPEEIALVSSASVVVSEYGSSVCFIMKSGEASYIPVSTMSELEIGDSVDMNKAMLVRLSMPGKDDILRVV